MVASRTEIYDIFPKKKLDLDNRNQLQYLKFLRPVRLNKFELSKNVYGRTDMNNMRRIIIAACLVMGIMATKATKESKPWDNGRLLVSSNQRFLQFENGKPFFLLGETAWLMPERLDRNEVQFYLSRCRQAGLNMVQVQVMDGVPSFNIYGQMSLPHGWDLSKADPDAYTVTGSIWTIL